MTQKAVQLKVNGSKTYKVVDAHRDITKKKIGFGSTILISSVGGAMQLNALTMVKLKL